MGKADNERKRRFRRAENEKSRLPVGDTERRQTEMDTQQAHSVPRSDSTTGSGTAQLFSQILPTGAENAVSTAELMEQLGMSDERVIRKMISEERAAGAVILSNTGGYFLPSEGERGRQEAAKFIATVTKKGAHTLMAARSAQAFLDKLPGQMEIGGGAGATEKGGDQL